jgi:hypothetical protein
LDEKEMHKIVGRKEATWKPMLHGRKVLKRKLVEQA